MALQTFRTDDLTGESDAQTVVIIVNDTGWEVDLAAASLAKLTKALEPFVRVGTESAYSVERKGAGSKRTKTGAVDPKAVRAWADSHGIPVGRNGRIPREIVEQYLRA